jgi:hypothetical protein
MFLRLLRASTGCSSDACPLRSLKSFPKAGYPPSVGSSGALALTRRFAPPPPGGRGLMRPSPPGRRVGDEGAQLFRMRDTSEGRRGSFPLSVRFKCYGPEGRALRARLRTLFRGQGLGNRRYGRMQCTPTLAETNACRISRTGS